MPKTWLITGYSSGLGMEIAKAVLRRGDHVAMTARNLAGLQAMAQEYRNRRCRILYRPLERLTSW